jgi:hypothetical protein
MRDSMPGLYPQGLEGKERDPIYPGYETLTFIFCVSEKKMSLTDSTACHSADLAALTTVLNSKLAKVGLTAKEFTAQNNNVGPEEYNVRNGLMFKGVQHRFKIIRTVDGWCRTWANVYENIEELIHATQNCMQIILMNAEEGQYSGYDPEGMPGNRDLQDREPLRPNRLCLNDCVILTESNTVLTGSEDESS